MNDQTASATQGTDRPAISAKSIKAAAALDEVIIEVNAERVAATPAERRILNDARDLLDRWF